MDDTLVLTGATASGKSALALEVARRTGAEIISMDSRQVYRGLDIGTAKPTAAERAAVSHHGVDVVDPDVRYSAGRFARDAHRWLREIRARGHPALIVGGTGFFLRALTHPLFREPEIDRQRARALERHLDTLSGERLREWAASLGGGDTAPSDRQRLLRWIEVAVLTGRTLEWWHRHAAPAEPPLAAPIVVIERPRDELYARIDERVSAMLDAGLVDEVRALRAAGWSAADPGMNATGYAEILAHLDGALSLEEAAERIRAATRRYARRQETWFRHQLPEHAVRMRIDDDRDAMVERLIERMTEEVRA